MVRVERPAANPKEPLSVEEARKLLTSTRDDGDQAAWAVMLLLGLRRSDHRAITMPMSGHLPEPVYVFGTKIGSDPDVRG